MSQGEMVSSQHPTNGLSPADATDGDPFNITPKNHRTQNTLASYDNRTLASAGSPSQARRALEAHIADTARRIQDASKLGTSLLDQKKRLAVVDERRFRRTGILMIPAESGNKSVNAHVLQDLSLMEAVAVDVQGINRKLATRVLVPILALGGVG